MASLDIDSKPCCRKLFSGVGIRSLLRRLFAKSVGASEGSALRVPLLCTGLQPGNFAVKPLAEFRGCLEYRLVDGRRPKIELITCGFAVKALNVSFARVTEKERLCGFADWSRDMGLGVAFLNLLVGTNSSKATRTSEIETADLNTRYRSQAWALSNREEEPVVQRQKKLQSVLSHRNQRGDSCVELRVSWRR